MEHQANTELAAHIRHNDHIKAQADNLLRHQRQEFQQAASEWRERSSVALQGEMTAMLRNEHLAQAKLRSEAEHQLASQRKAIQDSYTGEVTKIQHLLQRRHEESIQSERESVQAMQQRLETEKDEPVSYTHLTLPTKRIV